MVVPKGGAFFSFLKASVKNGPCKPPKSPTKSYSLHIG